jgi:hypothetical protein
VVERGDVGLDVEDRRAVHEVAADVHRRWIDTIDANEAEADRVRPSRRTGREQTDPPRIVPEEERYRSMVPGSKIVLPRSSCVPSLRAARTAALMASECSGWWSGIAVWAKRVPAVCVRSQPTVSRISYQPALRKRAMQDGRR